MSSETLDLLVVGAGPTGIAIGAAARRAGLDVLVMDKGPLVASLHAYPTDLVFFTTRERLEIADVPFAIPEVKPNRRQALVYYREVVRRHGIPLALHETFVEARPVAEAGGGGPLFEAVSRKDGFERRRRARAVAISTGYFDGARRLGVPGEDLPWVLQRYRDPYRHFDQDVVIIGGGNSATKTALDLWRNGVRVTLIHRRAEVKPSVKYWIRPDFDNRVAEGSIQAHFETTVRAFHPATASRRGVVEAAGSSGRVEVEADAAYVLIGYEPDVALLRRCGVEVEPERLIPAFDPETCETNVPGLYVAGTIQAGVETNRIFIENSRDHGARIVGHLKERRGF